MVTLANLEYLIAKIARQFGWNEAHLVTKSGRRRSSYSVHVVDANLVEYDMPDAAVSRRELYALLKGIELGARLQERKSVRSAIISQPLKRRHP